MCTEPKPPPSLRERQAVYRLTDAEIDELRERSRKSSVWAKQQLAIDPELKHLGPAGGSKRITLPEEADTSGQSEPVDPLDGRGQR